MSTTSELPPNVQLSLASTHAVLPVDFIGRDVMEPSYLTTTSSGKSIFPLDLTKPFVATHPSFLSLLGPNPSLKIIASSEVQHGGDGHQFAHEAGVWIEETKEVFFTSNLLQDPNPRNQISKIKLDALESGRAVGSSWDNITPSPDVVTGNGATLYGQSVLVCSQGLGKDIPSSLAVVDPLPPYKSHQILNNFHGRAFNSINDVVILPAPSDDPSKPHPTTDRSDLHHLPNTTIWFTDPTYGYIQHYKPRPSLPNQVYCFNPSSGDIRVVADGFSMPNGLCFNWEGDKCYITDTGVVNLVEGDANLSINGAREGTIYVYDVVRPPHGADLTAEGPTLHNRRVFAFIDSGVPDGIKCDRKGNVYSGCGDGVQVWNKHGTLIGKVVLFPDEAPTSLPSSDPKHQARYSANFCFIKNELFILAEDRIYIATLAEDVEGAL